MAEVSITINTGNAAFDDSPSTEIGRILSKCANEITGNDSLFDPDSVRKNIILYDYNGNHVGSCEIEPE